MSSLHSLKVRDLIDAIRRAMAEARQAAEGAAEKRESYRVNPALRGAQSAGDAEREIAEEATEAIRQAQGKARDAIGKLGAALGAWSRAASPISEVADRAWMLRGAPIIAAGGTVNDVIALAIARGDADLLHGAHANVAGHVVAGMGGRWTDAAGRAVEGAIRSIEDAQEQHRLADADLIEQRKAFRQADALTDEFEESLKYSTKLAQGSARALDAITLGVREQRTEAGDADAVPV